MTKHGKDMSIHSKKSFHTSQRKQEQDVKLNNFLLLNAMKATWICRKQVAEERSNLVTATGE